MQQAAIKTMLSFEKRLERGKTYCRGSSEGVHLFASSTFSGEELGTGSNHADEDDVEAYSQNHQESAVEAAALSDRVHFSIY